MTLTEYECFGVFRQPNFMSILRNECLVDIIAQEINEKGCFKSHMVQIGATNQQNDQTIGLLKNQPTQQENFDNYKAASKLDQRTTIEKVFDA